MLFLNQTIFVDSSFVLFINAAEYDGLN